MGKESSPSFEPKQLYQARVISQRHAARVSENLQKPVIVVGPGVQYQRGEQPSPQLEGSRDRERFLGKVRKVGGKVMAVFLGATIAVGVGNAFRDGASSEKREGAPACQTVTMSGPERSGGLVTASKEDRQAAQAALNELPGGYQVENTPVGGTMVSSEKGAEIFGPGTEVTFCVTDRGVSTNYSSSESATAFPGSAAEFSAVIPGNPESDDPESD